MRHGNPSRRIATSQVSGNAPCNRRTRNSLKKTERLSAALNTVEPPILEFTNAKLLESDKPWSQVALNAPK